MCQPPAAHLAFFYITYYALFQGCYSFRADRPVVFNGGQFPRNGVLWWLFIDDGS